ncbi:Proteasome subunit beta type-7 [Eufriesea mexicana]|uniref:Proteasome subunit beta n=1 Tax=Eufriesea mexicana TaxID=516756 RepID=A0A310SB68_9HYME|nr:PREDICTED: proteasome subunit beta type-7 [Eufriesea mexicana]OAD54006.1 Proteasome subunit beta type-7 [Eufriesea mexicana]
MSSILIPEIPAPGFSFDLCKRNNFLVQKGFQAPKAVKTGTTIAGIVYKDGIVLGGDTRSTENTIVADKNCSKIHYLAENIYCCGAGTAADTEMTTQMISSQLELHRLNTNRLVPVCTANAMIKQLLFRYQGHIGAALILGGVDLDGPHLFSIYPHGSSDNYMYTSMGTGSLAAMALFESRWKANMTEEEAKLLVADAIRAGVFNDLASGSNVDLCVIRKGSVDYLRPYDVANVKGQRNVSYRYKRGTTAVLNKTIHPIIVEGETVRQIRAEPMDTSS